MDPLTHALTGSLIADALPFSRRLGPKAPLVAAFAAAAPDLDMLPAIIANFPPESLSYGELLNRDLVRQFHRGYTHSFLVTALASIPLGWAAWRWSGRKGSWPLWSLLILLAFFSHIVLDIVTPWGVKAYLPFSAERAVWGGQFALFNPSIMIVLGLVFIFNHVLRDSHADSPDALPAPGTWRRRTGELVDRLVHSELLGLVGVALIAGRILIAGM